MRFTSIQLCKSGFLCTCLVCLLDMLLHSTSGALPLFSNKISIKCLISNVSDLPMVNVTGHDPLSVIIYLQQHPSILQRLIPLEESNDKMLTNRNLNIKKKIGKLNRIQSREFIPTLQYKFQTLRLYSDYNRPMARSSKKKLKLKAIIMDIHIAFEFILKNFYQKKCIYI